MAAATTQSSPDYGGDPASQYELQHSPTRSVPPRDEWDDEFDNEDDFGEMSLTELLYSSSSFYAIVKPVTLTLILAALAVVYINDESSIASGQQAMTQAYTVWKTDAGESGSKVIAISLLNSLVIVSFICAITFLIVLLYKFKCMTCLIGYMMFSSATLLGVLGGSMAMVAIQVFGWTVDKVTFYLGMANFAIVGVMAVFWAQGIPTYVSQGYLIATSVILAWQLSHFDDVTAWCLLIMLALYDLCAVLTPCGPLKALVHLMSEEDSPEMPGLLYEAELPTEARRPGIPQRGRSDLQQNPTTVSENESAGDSFIGDNRSTLPGADVSVAVSSHAGDVVAEGPLVSIPLAIALVYNLPIVDFSTPVTNPDAARVSGVPLLEEIPENPTPQQLRTIVTVRLPAMGGRIERQGRGKVYLERDRFGTPKRTLWVDRQGKVLTESTEEDDEKKSSNSIRLGLGDFIFYSVLVSKAAQYSFTTFAACTLVILSGLGGTLVLLSVYHHALPALPISIFLGVAFYILTRAFVEPWIEAVMSTPLYV